MRAEAYALTLPGLKVSLTPLPTLTPNSQLIHGNSNGIDLSNFGPLIAFAGVILAALIAFIGVVYQSRRTARIEKEKLAVQVELERERIRFQDEINAARVAQEQQRQRSEMDAEAVLAAMDRAKNITERDQAYRDALKADPRIARLQILDMSHPLDVANVFVRVRLHRETKPSYELDQNLLEAEALRDPNELLRVGSIYLERRVSSALDPDEAIRTFKRCVIVGDPGAGKTTLLKYLTLKAAENQLTGLPDLPIHIELNAFASSQCRDLLDFASTRWEDRYGFPKVEARAYMEEKLKTGSALLLLDALDETVIGDIVDEAEASYTRAVDAVMQVATRYHRSPVVVTARKAGYQQRTRLDGFTELEVLDFRPEDIERFVRNWFAGSPSLNQYVNAANLNAKLARNPRLRTLAANPLLLSLIVIVYEDQLDLPDRRAELYRQCVDTLLTRWDTSRDIRRRREFKPEHKRQLLDEVAWRFHNQGKRYIPESELVSHIESFLPAVGLSSGQSIRVLEEIAAENGLLKEQARHWYGFLHMTLQEYFVAQYVAKHSLFEELLIHLGDPWWEEVLLLYAGLTPDASPLLQQLIGPGNYTLLQEDIFHTRLLFAGQCLAARPTVRQLSLREDILSRLFEVLTTTPYLITREQVSNTLAEIGGIEINTHLVNLLADDKKNGTLRLKIAVALGEMGERTVAPELMRLLADGKQTITVRRAIADALGKLGERTVAPELMRLLADDKQNKDVRRAIADALGELGERTVAPELMRLLADGKQNITVRRAIADALGELGERTVAPELMRLLADDKQNKDVHALIGYILGKLGERAVVPELVRLLADNKLDQVVRRLIAFCLGELGDQTVVPELVRLLADDKQNMYVRQAIAFCLGELGERTVAPKLVRLLADDKLYMPMRGVIADALGKLGERTVVSELNHLLSGNKLNKDIRWAIIYALGKLGERAVAPDLVRLLADDKLYPIVRMNIARVLGELGERKVVSELMRLVANDKLNMNVRRVIVTSAIEKLAYDVASVLSLSSLLQISDLSSTIHSILWTVSRRARVSVFIRVENAVQKIEIVEWNRY